MSNKKSLGLTESSVMMLREWWGDCDRTDADIANHFGWSFETIRKYRRELGLPVRARRNRKTPVDPTPEQIAERAAECRKRHFEYVRKNCGPNPQPGKLMSQVALKEIAPARSLCDGIL